MSLEDALNANTKAVLAHNALLEKMLAGGKAPAAATGKPADKPADKPASKPADKAPAKTSTTKRNGEITVEDVAARVTAYMKVDDKEVRDERRARSRPSSTTTAWIASRTSTRRSSRKLWAS